MQSKRRVGEVEGGFGRDRRNDGWPSSAFLFRRIYLSCLLLRFNRLVASSTYHHATILGVASAEDDRQTGKAHNHNEHQNTLAHDGCGTNFRALHMRIYQQRTERVFSLERWRR